ncbi:SufS family cysteine desulfurase [Thalassotalea euphylliae]|uniref:cysteine desulfurase n=1 Tax=Thalassotalea euphylliae TaxID=1655234 RepID=A0A3E0TTW6_9GAMM|nr:SufS family cysteine desulfurase [Thalassotalea euphylliae]REL27365.1 SufS family cysteine desulfurase [Thalassotalea euphylliae]
MTEFSPQAFRNQFPLLAKPQSTQPIVYFDNAATTQKPNCVIDEMTRFYQTTNANVHRASHQLSAMATTQFERARETAKHFINAHSEKEIIWTKGTTEAINIVAQCYAKPLFKAGDEIIVSYSEHHANIVPWQQVAAHCGAFIKVLPLDKTGRIDIAAIDAIITNKTKLVAVNLVSNVIGKRNPIEAIIDRAKAVNAKVLVDGAQAVAHEAIDVQKLGCDFFVFSAHKVYGPTGVGVLYGREALLEAMPPYQFGGEMIKKVSFSGTTFAQLPFKFETGTPNIAGVLGLAKALAFTGNNRQLMADYEQTLIDYTYERLVSISGVKLLFADKPDIPIFSFVLDNAHHQDVATFLNGQNIAIRAGHHCAMPLMEYLGESGCLRISLAPYNLTREVDTFIDAMRAFNHMSASSSTSLPADLSAISLESYVDRKGVEKQNALEEIQARFNSAKGWDGRHREIMLLSKQLERLSRDQRLDQYLVQGCESDVWLKAQVNQDGEWSFQADSDAKVIRGLLVIVFAMFNHQNAGYIESFDVEHHFKQLGLMEHLSPSRGNGVRAIVARIKDLAG